MAPKTGSSLAVSSAPSRVPWMVCGSSETSGNGKDAEDVVVVLVVVVLVVVVERSPTNSHTQLVHPTPMHAHTRRASRSPRRAADGGCPLALCARVAPSTPGHR